MTKIIKLKRIVIIFCLLIFTSESNASNTENEFKHGISIFGELKYPKNFAHLNYVNPNAPKGGEIKFAVEGGFNSLNSFILKGIPAEGLGYIFDSLMEGNSDEIASRYGLVAESARLGNDKMFIEFILREEAYFHDGLPITADDVIFTFNELVKNGHPSYKMTFRDVKRVIKLNQHKVRFEFNSNKNRDLPLLIASLPIIPKHFFKNHDFSKSNFGNNQESVFPLGSGPYKIKEAKQNRFIVYERVKNYWAKDLAINRGRYNFDEIRFDYYRDNNVLLEAFKAGKYDFRQENIARNWANSYDFAAIKKGETIKQEIEHHLPAPIQSFVLNLRREKFQNLALRKALNLAFDFEWLNQHIFYNAYIRTESYFANSEFKYPNFEMPKSDGSGFNRKNLLQAQEILRLAGYEFKNFQLLDPKTKKPVSIEFLINQKSFEMVIAPFLKNLAKLGIDAKTRLIEENQYQNRVNNFDFDIITAVYSQSPIPGSELFAYFHSSQKDNKGSRNLSGLNDKIIDELVEKISAAKSKDELKKLCQKLDQRLLEQSYGILQWHNNKHRIAYRNIFGKPKINPPYSLAVDSWWSLD